MFIWTTFIEITFRGIIFWPPINIIFNYRLINKKKNTIIWRITSLDRLRVVICEINRFWLISLCDRYSSVVHKIHPIDLKIFIRKKAAKVRPFSRFLYIDQNRNENRDNRGPNSVFQLASQFWSAYKNRINDLVFLVCLEPAISIERC